MFDTARLLTIFGKCFDFFTGESKVRSSFGKLWQNLRRAKLHSVGVYEFKAQAVLVAYARDIASYPPLHCCFYDVWS